MDEQVTPPMARPHAGREGRIGAGTAHPGAAGAGAAAPGPRIDPAEVEVSAVRAQGAGGQNVNKVSSAIHLRFDIRRSSLPPDHQERLLALRDSRINRDGVVVIKAQAHRSQELNRNEAFERLQALVDSVARPPRVRKPTRPTAASRQRRLQDKRLRQAVKLLRAPVAPGG